MTKGIKHIRIISPSGTINPEYIEGATQRLQSWGYRVSEGRYARGEYGRFSGTDDERLYDLYEALAMPDVDYILCSRGGYGLQRILDKINLSTFDFRPSTIIGFSDITALHQLIAISTIKYQLSTLHGLMCKHIATLPEDSEALQLFRWALDGKPLRYELPAHPLNSRGKADGTLIGGNLSVLYGLQGTPYSLNAVIDAHPEGVILFIEDIGERHYHIDRMMKNLRMSGVLERINGLVVGQFTDCDPDPLMKSVLCQQSGLYADSEAVYCTIREAVADYDYPILFDFPAGHVDDNRPLRLNAPARLEVLDGLGRLGNLVSLD